MDKSDIKFFHQQLDNLVAAQLTDTAMRLIEKTDLPLDKDIRHKKELQQKIIDAVSNVNHVYHQIQDALKRAV